MARHCKRFCLLLGALGALARPNLARAYDEQASLDLSAGYALVAQSSELPAHGAALDVGGGYGLGDVAVLRGSLGYALFSERTATRHAGRARIEALYLLDVLQVVPFFGGGVSVLLAEGAAKRVHARPGAHLLLGVDYLASRDWIVGVDVRSGLRLEPGAVRSATEVSLRLSRMFETF